VVGGPKLAPKAPALASGTERVTATGPQQPSLVARPRTVKFDEATEGTGTSVLQSAMRRQQKKVDKKEGKTLRDPQRDAAQKQKKEDRSEINVEYLESLHKQAKRKRQSTAALPLQTPHPTTNHPTTVRRTRRRVRDKEQLGGEQKSPRGAKKSREKSHLETGPHVGLGTEPPRSEKQQRKQGESMSLMQPQPLSNIHPFLSTLREWQAGIQVDCGPEWDMTTCDAAVERGPHPSAQTAEAIELFAEDISYQEKAGFCQVFLWDELRSLHPKSLKISPVAVVPQEGRRGRIILDQSFPVYQEVDGVVSIIQSSVNDTTEIKRPQRYQSRKSERSYTGYSIS
jgi:hypothetical protein